MAVNLGELLKDVPKFDTGREQIEYIRLDRLDEDPNNFYQLTDIDNLAANIELCGLQQPIRVRPVPDTDRYVIVSGHRRRKAVELLAKDNPERWDEVPCIVEIDAVSPSLQQLRLIFANSHTRKMTPAETSEQIEQVEKLLYRLKEEEGYEFPGRMRDYVAQVVGASKSKIARLKVIRDNLDKCWEKSFKKDDIKEDAAYTLAQMPKEWQKLIFTAIKEKRSGSRMWVYASDLKYHKDNLTAIEKSKCFMDHKPCAHIEQRKQQAVRSDYLWNVSCTKCCKDCSNLARCKSACPKLADQVKQMKETQREASRQAKLQKEEEDRPYIEHLKVLWQRFGSCRAATGNSVQAVYKAIDRYYSKADDKRVEDLESLQKKITRDSETPFGYTCRLSDVRQLIALADLFGVSLDYLFGRSNVKEMAAAAPVSESDTEESQFISGTWYPATVEPPVGVELILIDSGGYTDTGKYKGCGEYTMDYGYPIVLWTLMPQERDVSTAPPAVAGWRTGNPEAYGTYAAYVTLEGVKGPMLRELYWNGEWWAMHNERIADEVTVVCWADRPDF